MNEVTESEVKAATTISGDMALHVEIGQAGREHFAVRQSSGTRAYTTTWTMQLTSGQMQDVMVRKD